MILTVDLREIPRATVSYDFLNSLKNFLENAYEVKLTTLDGEETFWKVKDVIRNS